MTTTSAKLKQTSGVKDQYYIPYPRNTIARHILRFIGRVLAFLLLRLTIRGRENYPKQGPVILVANHVAFIEGILMVIYPPMQAEFMATGDVPLEPKFAWWANRYKYVTVKRGSMDRKAMGQALSILEQGGAVIMFPEGGIWNKTLSEGRSGVAWLSAKANAPILPIGFGGTGRAVARIFRWQRPRVEMNIGKLIPPIQEKVPGKTRKEALADGARRVMVAIGDLIPEFEKKHHKIVEEESFELRFALEPSANGSTPQFENAEALAKFFHRPRLLDAMRRNLEMPVGPLENLRDERDPAKFAEATASILDYLEENPYFFTYRFGNDEGHAMEAAIRELHDVVSTAAKDNYGVHIQPVRRYRMEGETETQVDDYPREVLDI